jgi:hypothetical protein
MGGTGRVGKVWPDQSPLYSMGGTSRVGRVWPGQSSVWVGPAGWVGCGLTRVLCIGGFFLHVTKP